MQFLIKAYDGEGMLEKRMAVRPRHLEGIALLGQNSHVTLTMKSKKKQKKLRITEADFMLANRPVSFRKAIHKSKKVYDRKRLKRAGGNVPDTVD